MKKIFLWWAAFLVGCLPMLAQGDCVIPMMVLVPEQAEGIPSTAQATLETRLRQMVTQGGMEGGAKFANFCVVANTVEASKEQVSGLRPVVALTIELDLFVGNNYTGEKFASTTITLNGAGRSEAKAYSAAFGSINSGNAQMQAFLKEAKKKVYEYYEAQMADIILQAKKFAALHEYEEALCLLASVPTCCSRYADVEQCLLSVFQAYIDYDCATKVAKARAIWNATQNEEGAALAGAYLMAMDPSSSCWDDALTLAETIRQRIGDEWEFAKELQRDAVQLERARIEAMRAIGVAYGENQKAKTINEHWIVR